MRWRENQLCFRLVPSIFNTRRQGINVHEVIKERKCNQFRVNLFKQSCHSRVMPYKNMIKYTKIREHGFPQIINLSKDKWKVQGKRTGGEHQTHLHVELRLNKGNVSYRTECRC